MSMKKIKIIFIIILSILFIKVNSAQATDPSLLAPIITPGIETAIWLKNKLVNKSEKKISGWKDAIEKSYSDDGYKLKIYDRTSLKIGKSEKQEINFDNKKIIFYNAKFNDGYGILFIVTNLQNIYIVDLCTEESDSQIVAEATNGGEIQMKNFLRRIFSEYASYYDLGPIEEDPAPVQVGEHEFLEGGD